MNPASVWKLDVPGEEGACAVCKKVTQNRCMACKTVYYCSTDHQKLDWKTNHKKNCGSIELVNDPYVGRHYVAKRNIDPGEIVLREKEPLVTIIASHTSHICVNCYMNVEAKERKLCTKCGWWLLCSNCKQHGAECEFTIKYGKFKHLPDHGKAAREEYRLQDLGIGVIRMLALRETNPKAYLKFMKHEDHGLKMKGHHADKLATDVAKLVLKFFKIDNVDEMEIAKINRILMINAFGDEKHSGYFAEKTSYFEHNCRPNCSKTLPDNDNNGSFLVWAVRPIAAGEHLSICYHNGNMGTMVRKSWLASTKFFDCTCRRCEDPTEFGTMFNAVKCIEKPCKGDMLPATFKMCAEKYPDFVCCECKVAVSSKDVALMQRFVENQLYAIQEEDVYAYKCFIKTHAGILHKNHFYMIQAKLKLADVLGFDAYITSDVTMVSDDELNEKIGLSEEIRELHELLMPGTTTYYIAFTSTVYCWDPNEGYTRCRGRLLYGAGIALSEKFMRAGHSGDKKILLNKLIKLLTETCKLLCYEPQSSEEGQMAQNAMELLQLVKLLS